MKKEEIDYCPECGCQCLEFDQKNQILICCDCKYKFKRGCNQIENQHKSSN